jgi:hypothetical protein
MNVNLLSPEAGRTVRIGLVIYEKVFSIVSEVNYRCGPVNGTGLTVSDAFTVLLNKCLAGLSGLDQIHFNVQQNESENPDTVKMSVDLDAESSRILTDLTTSLNKVMGLPREITGEVILELLVRRCSRELRGFLFAKYRRDGFRPIKL